MSTYFKYPRTPHLPWSLSVSSDDLSKKSVSVFTGVDVVVTEKMDGENTTLYQNHLHARSLDSRHHPSRDWLKQWHGGMAHTIPDGWRICGENLFARHSVSYQQLGSYFYGFSVWNENNECLSWDETIEWFAMLSIHPVPVLYKGLWDENTIRELTIDTDKQEGYVVRSAGKFHYDEFSQRVAKWVRADHVTTDKHWMHSEVVPNGLRSKNDKSS